MAIDFGFSNFVEIARINFSRKVLWLLIFQCCGLVIMVNQVRSFNKCSSLLPCEGAHETVTAGSNNCLTEGFATKSFEEHVVVLTHIIGSVRFRIPFKESPL